MEENIIELIKEGYSYKQISTLTNISRTKISKIAEENNTLSSLSKSVKYGKENGNNGIWVCLFCGETKSRSEFCNNSVCKECKPKYYNKFSQLYSTIKSTGKFVDISIEDLENLWEEQDQKCFYSKRVMTRDWNHLNTVSVDRVDSNLGYTLDNIVLCCSAVNYMKRDLSVEDFISFCKDITANN